MLHYTGPRRATARPEAQGGGSMADGRLSAKQEAFARAYVGEARFVASDAARMVGYTEKYGCDIRKNPEVSARISELLAEHAMSGPEVLSELSDIARADWREFVKIRYDKTGEWANPRVLQAQFRGVKDKDVEQFRDPKKQVVIYPDQYKTGDVVVPFEKARK